MGPIRRSQPAMAHRCRSPAATPSQQMVTAESVGANTSSFLTLDLLVPVTPCACESTKWGFWSAYNGLKDSSGNLVFEDQGNLSALGRRSPHQPSKPACDRHGHLHRPRDRQYRPSGGSVGTSYLAAGTFSAAVNFGARNGAITIGGLDGTNYAGTAVWVPSTVTFNGTLTGNVGSRTAALAGSFFQGGRNQYDPALWRNGRFAHPERGGRLPRKRDFCSAQAIGRGGGARSEVLPVRPCRERLSLDKIRNMRYPYSLERNRRAGPQAGRGEIAAV